MYTNRAHCRALRLMFALRKEQAYFINLNGICLRLRPKGVQGASGKPPASGMIRQLCRNQFPVGGRVGFDIPWVSRQLRCPKVSKGRAESPLVRPQAHTPCPGWGLTRRLRRGSGTCRPMGRSHFSFDGERKVCKRKPAARRLREKGSYCPFCRRGSQCRAQ